MNDRGIEASADRINRAASVTYSTQTDRDVRHDGAGLGKVHRATAVPDASSASGRYATGKPLEKSPIPVILAVLEAASDDCRFQFMTWLWVVLGSALSVLVAAAGHNGVEAGRRPRLDSRH
jgi:hypothetical protein